jgi:hypothetical protein
MDDSLRRGVAESHVDLDGAGLDRSGDRPLLGRVFSIPYGSKIAVDGRRGVYIFES